MKVWMPNVDSSRTGGPFSFTGALASWLCARGHEVTADCADSDIDVALAISTIESPELRTFKRRRVPIVQRIDGVPYDTPGSDLLQAAARLRRCYEVADAVAFQANFSMRSIEPAFGKCACAHRIIYNGVDLSLFPFREEISDRRPVTLACAGVWRPHKRLAATVRGFLAFNKRLPAGRLLVIGPTDRVPEEVIGYPSISYLGALSRTETARALASADIFLHLAWLDNCPNVVLEAQATGLPVLCTNCAGTRELLLPKTGVVIESDPERIPPPVANIYSSDIIPGVPAEAVADAIETVASELNMRRERLRQGRDWLGIERAGREYIELFEVLRSGGVRRPWRRSFWGLVLQSVARKITGRSREPRPLNRDVLVLTARKGFWASEQSRIFPSILYSHSGPSGSRRVSAPLLVRAIFHLLFRRPQLVIVAAAPRVAKWMLYLRHRGFLRKPKLIVHNMVLFWYGLAAYADRVIVYSSKEAEYHAEHLPGSERFVFVPLPAAGDFTIEQRSSTPPYIFAGGSARRDYASLIEAVRGLPVELKIRCKSADRFNYSGELPENVAVGYAVPTQEFLQEMKDALFVVVPLEKTELPHGHTTVAQAMRLGKAVIATRGASVEDYIADRVDGLLVDAGDPTAYRCAIEELLEDAELRDTLGAAALKKSQMFTFENYACELSRICQELLR